jgi:two-component system NtrC family sensor kinase
MNSNLGRMHDRETRDPEPASLKASSSKYDDKAADLTKGIAHAVRNPLSIIQLGVEFLNSHGGLDRQSEEVLRDMNDAVRRLDLIIQELQNTTRTEALNLQPGNVHEVIEQALATLEPDFVANRIEVTKQFYEKHAEWLIDAGQIRQVLVNILKNASQAMPRGGELTVLTRNDNGLRIEIRDTGSGIVDEDLNRVFDPFFTTQARVDNAGLGLSSSRNVIALHGGSMQLENLPDGGVSVVLSFETEKREDL